MKAYTSLSQSITLGKFLPLESADMNYWCGTQIRIGGHRTMDKDLDVPCWSLAALLDVINDDYYTSLYHDGVAWNVKAIHHDNVKDKHSIYANTPVDACVDMIENLHEQKLL